MFFEKENLSFQLLDVMEFEEENVYVQNTGRHFDAISFRYHANAYLESEKSSLHVKDGAVCYVPANLPYLRRGSYDKLIVAHLEMNHHYASDVEYFFPKDPAPLATLFSELLLLWQKKEIGYRYRCQALLYQILAECYIQNENKRSCDSRILPSVEYLKTHLFDSNLSVATVAKQSFVSEVYFRKLFAKSFGISPRKYIVKTRIQTACELTRTGDYSLKEIAYRCGFADYSYFSIEFKRQKGLSPLAYLQSFQKRDGEEPSF